MSPQPPKLLTGIRAWTCFMINQLATPGLGSLMARRIVPGACQLALALVGFALLVGWMVEYSYHQFLRQMDEPVPTGSNNWLAIWGLIVFGASWLWSLVTSLSLIRQAKADEQASQEGAPPVIAQVPPAQQGTGR